MTKQYGILAYPAKHSLSPVMHNAAFKELGIDAQYGVFEIAPENLAEFMEQVKHEPVSGLSVSLPHKERMMEFLNEIDEDARAIGAVNTVHNKGGFLYGYNTDFVGAVRALKEACPDLSGKKAVVLGAGGASRAICYGLLKEGCEIVILNIDKGQADKLKADFEKILSRGLSLVAGDFSSQSRITTGGLDEVHDDAVGGDILVQATSIWTLNPDISEEETEKFCPKSFVERFEVVFEVAYKPLVTPLVQVAQDFGKKVVTGDKMLLYQAVEQFEIWTGEKAPVGVMREALGEGSG